MKDKELREELIELGVLPPVGRCLTQARMNYISFKRLVNELRSSGVLEPAMNQYTCLLPGAPNHKDLIKQIAVLEKKLNAILELSNIKEIEKGRCLKKGNKEVDY